MDEKEIRQAIHSCVKCGKCLARCPVFRENRDEKLIARGKIALLEAILDGEMPASNLLHRAAEDCLYCLNCQASCPGHLPLDRIIPYLRATAGTAGHLAGLSRRSIDLTAGDPGLFKMAIRAAKPLVKLSTRKVPGTRGINLRLGLPNFPRDRFLPDVAPISLLGQFPTEIPGDPAKPVVGFFAGCLHTFLAMPAGRAIVKILQTLRLGLVIPAGQSCCGLPFAAMGLEESNLRHARRNIDAFSSRPVDVIVSGCPSCVSHLRDHYSLLGSEGRNFAGKVTDLPTFLLNFHEELHSVIEPIPAGFYACYHDPCHLAVGLKVRRQPRELLRLIYGNQFLEMSEADRCCGGGGSYSMTHYDSARKIGVRKVDAVTEWERLIEPRAGDGTKIEAGGGSPSPYPSGSASAPPLRKQVITACPGCQMQLTDLLLRNGNQVEVTDLYEALADRLIKNVL